MLWSHALTRGPLAGTLNALAAPACEQVTRVPALITLVPFFTAALQAYQMRAIQCRRSFAHMVLLEGAVQGWHDPAFLVHSFASISLGVHALIVLWHKLLTILRCVLGLPPCHHIISCTHMQTWMVRMWPQIGTLCLCEKVWRCVQIVL